MFVNGDTKIALSRERGIDVIEWFYDLDVYCGEPSVLGASQEDIDEWISDLREQERLRLERNF